MSVSVSAGKYSFNAKEMLLPPERVSLEVELRAVMTRYE